MPQTACVTLGQLRQFPALGAVVMMLEDSDAWNGMIFCWLSTFLYFMAI